ncbi:MAG: sulfatase-like hydrolase/transferase [Anaerolineae bacterium]|nr:sulfatase-like hydrolase/transferase [Anaerolineae bacterium]
MNAIVIVTDSLRVDHIGCYGSEVQTPNLDKFAQAGALFEHAYADSLPTIPMRTTWWTGTVGFPYRHWRPFEPSDYLLAEILWDRGFTSALITDTYHMHKPVYNCGRGFDTVVWVRGQEYDPWIVDPEVRVDLGPHHRLRGDETDVVWRPRFEQYLRNRTMFRTEEEYPAPQVAIEAIRWLDYVVKDKGQKDNLFLWVDFFDPHEPWDPPEPYWSLYDPAYHGQEIIDPVPGDIEGYMTPEEVAHTRALYAGEVTFVDHWVGVLLDHVRALGLFDNSLIMHTSDHGEPFGEHGFIRKAHDWNFEELVHIPWLIRHPEGIGAGQRFGQIVQSQDLMPTVLDFLGIAGPLELPFSAPGRTPFPQDVVVDRKAVTLDGTSLLPLMAGEVEAIRDYAYTGHGHRGHLWSIRSHDWSYLLPIRGENPELYDRRTDPSEQSNVIHDHPELGEHLELELRRFVDSLLARHSGERLS